MIKVRESVQNFAEMMEQVLRDNDHRGGWEETTFRKLRQGLKREVADLDEAMMSLLAAKFNNGSIMVAHKRRAAIKEAVDVANYAMMIVDNLLNRRISDDELN